MPQVATTKFADRLRVLPLLRGRVSCAVELLGRDLRHVTMQSAAMVENFALDKLSHHAEEAAEGWRGLSEDIIRTHFASFACSRALNRHWRDTISAEITSITLGDKELRDGGMPKIADRIRISFPNLIHLKVKYVFFRDCASVGSIPGLTHLNLNGTLVNDEGCRNLAGLTNLSTLDVGDTKFGNEGCEGLSRLTSITQLKADSPYLDDRGCSEISSLPRLVTLDISRTRVGDAGAAALPALSATLQELRMSRTEITNEACKDIGRLTQLLRLDISATLVGDSGAAHLATLTKLRSLFMTSCCIGDGICHLAHLTNLEELNIYETRIGDGCCLHLTNLVNLRDLGIEWAVLSSHNENVIRKSLPMLNR